MPERTDQSRTCTDASPAPTAKSPFGPVRKREKPVGIPGQRQPSPSSISPRPAPPTRPLTARPVDLPDDFRVDHALGNYGPGAYGPGAA